MRNPRQLRIGVVGAKADYCLGTIRELTRPDLEILRQGRSAPVVQSLRDSHHRVARLLASGLRIREVVAQSGYGHNRIITLKKDPAFCDLVESYRKDVDASFREEVDEFHGLMVENRMLAERMLNDKLTAADAADETLPTRDLLAISRDAADRTGYGKKQTNVNVNVDFAAALERARQRSGKVITIARSPSLASGGAQEGQQLSSPSEAPPLRLRRI